MAYLTERFVGYLGKPALYATSDSPLVDWKFIRSPIEFDGDSIDYQFINNGIDLSCDSDDNIHSIFIHNDSRKFTGLIVDIPFEMRRDDVLRRIGIPCKSGDPINDSILGHFGAWDRFDSHDHSMHIQYHSDGDGIALITFMRPSVVPS
jgi:hypothetical protein